MGMLEIRLEIIRKITDMNTPDSELLAIHRHVFPSTREDILNKFWGKCQEKPFRKVAMVKCIYRHEVFGKPDLGTAKRLVEDWAERNKITF